MEWKMLGIKGKLTSTKQKVLNLFRLIGGLENQDSNGCSSDSTFTDTPYVPLELLKKYALEVELERAVGLDYWRRWMDRPK